MYAAYEFLLHAFVKNHNSDLGFQRNCQPA